jgi:hypothetical protein
MDWIILRIHPSFPRDQMESPPEPRRLSAKLPQCLHARRTVHDAYDGVDVLYFEVPK